MHALRTSLFALLFAAVAAGTARASDAWNQLRSQLDAGGTVTLAANVTAESGDSTLVVSTNVTLDLNGHVLDAAGRFGVIRVASGGRLVLANGGGAGGAVTGGSADRGGGVYVASGGAFEMTGGTVSGGSADYGGGVYVADGGAFTMTGGAVSGNSAERGGGGVYVSEAGTFAVSGAPVVSSNTKSGGTANNVYLASGQTIAVNGLATGASIGVTADATPTKTKPVVVATGAAAGDEARFSSDNPDFAIGAGDGEVRLVRPATAWDELQARLDAGGTVALAADTTATAADATLVVATDATLDLNGHVLDAAGRFGVIKVAAGGRLTLANGGAARGAVAGGRADCGGAVFVDDGGAFTMAGGTVTNNAAYAGGGVYVESGGTFAMNGGTITGNTAEQGGGGVEVYGTFAMGGGAISGNAAGKGGGGGVHAGGGRFEMSGGTISGNTANGGGGVFAVAGCALALSGSPVVTDNADPAGAADNLFLETGATIDAAGLAAGASVGVTTRVAPLLSAPVVVATNAVAGDAARFSSDNPAFETDFADGKVRLVRIVTAWDRLKLQLDAGGLVTLAEDVAAVAGDSTLIVTNDVTLDLNGHVLDAAGRFGVIQVADGGRLVLTNGAAAAGAVTGGCADYGGAVYVCETGVFEMAGGVLTNNVAKNGGGGVYVFGGRFEMSGGTIVGNVATNHGGGVYVDYYRNNYGAFGMTGGTISGNTAGDCGGGVYVNDYGTFSVSGASVVSGNAGYAGTTNNVYLGRGRTITASGLAAGASIGVTALESPTKTAPVVVATGTAAGDEARFSSDDPAYVIGAGNGEVRLLRPPTAWDQLQARLDAGGTVALEDDTTATDIDATLLVTNAVTLDLNGHALDAARLFGAIRVNAGGRLVLANGGGAAGVLTGGSADRGGGVYVAAGGTFAMTGGIVTNSTANYGGGVYVAARGAFAMTGGTVTGNNAEQGGGGVYVGEDGSFEMAAGAISGNVASHGGGVEAAGSFAMGGGTISGNTSDKDGGGVYAVAGCTFTVSGSPVVTGNAEDNVQLETGVTIDIAAAGLASGAAIGVTAGTAPATNAPVRIANGAVAGAAARFSSDDPAFDTAFAAGSVWLAIGAVTHVKPDWAAEADEAAFWAWVDAKCSGDYETTDYTAQYLLNVPSDQTPVKLRIDGIAPVDGGATIAVSATAGGDPVDLAAINGALFVEAGATLANLVPKAVASGNVTYDDATHVATILVPVSDGTFVRARVGFSAP